MVELRADELVNREDLDHAKQLGSHDRRQLRSDP
jgi:hypothetical protein